MAKILGLKKLETWGERSSFRYTGSVKEGTGIFYGSKFKIRITANMYEDLLKKFKGRTVDCGTSRTSPPLGSLGEWLKENVSKTAIASYVGAILVNEGYAKKRKSQIEFH